MVKKNVFIVVFVVGVSVLFGASAIFFLQGQNLQKELSRERGISNKIEEEMQRLKRLKEKVEQENDRITQASVAHLNLNNRLQKENQEVSATNAALLKQIEEIKSAIEDKDGTIATLKDELKETPGGSSAAKKIEDLECEVHLLKERAHSEKAVYYYNLGVAFAKAQLYEEAIKAHEQSLQLHYDNPEAYYNLGLLYEKVSKEPEKAILYYRKYLRLHPDAQDKERVQKIIDELSQVVFRP